MDQKLPRANDLNDLSSIRLLLKFHLPVRHYNQTQIGKILLKRSIETKYQNQKIRVLPTLFLKRVY